MGIISLKEGSYYPSSFISAIATANFIMLFLLRLLFIAAITFYTPLNLYSQISAKTQDGQSVILYDDGTWKYDSSDTFSDVPYSYNDNIFITTHRNGTRSERKIKFAFRQENYDVIKESIALKEWEEQTFSNPKNAGFIERYKEWDKVILYVDRWISNTAACQMYKLNNSNSFDFVADSEGSIYVNSDGEMIITFFFSAQNGYGNTITKQVANPVSLSGHELSLDSCISF